MQIRISAATYLPSPWVFSSCWYRDVQFISSTPDVCAASSPHLCTGARCALVETFGGIVTFRKILAKAMKSVSRMLVGCVLGNHERREHSSEVGSSPRCSASRLCSQRFASARAARKVSKAVIAKVSNSILETIAGLSMQKASSRNCQYSSRKSHQKRTPSTF